ncbi:NAD(P)H-hydrate dehydratase [Neisseriaceae bacterium ESL0693]|nr:NAD(P)H-hydrate dehydratase [Neisseriaceae bacterium ESL0693]
MIYQLDQQTLRQYQAYARRYFPLLCQPRPIDSHKGTFGTLAILGGHTGMSGALILAGCAALKTGCGKVWLGFNQPRIPLPVITDRPEIMLTTLTALSKQTSSAYVMGCGLGTDHSALTALRHFLDLSLTKPLLLDADALNLIARQPELWPDQCIKTYPWVLTPHPAEAARLLHSTTAEIQHNRTAAVLQLAQRYGTWVVLKGHESLIASPEGHIHHNTSGNAGLATAGSGDVLSGVIGSLLAQGIPIQQAIYAGVWLHGAAADVLVAHGIGPIGLCAHELADAIRWLRNQLTEHQS